jgi:hypothetical protein
MTALLAHQLSQAVEPLLPPRGGGLSPPTLLYWHIGYGNLHIQPSIRSTQSPGQTSLKFYSCSYSGGTSEHFFLAKEASRAAFCGLPPSTLGLRHRLRPMAYGTAVAPGGGHTFCCCTTSSNWPFGGGFYSDSVV